MPDSVQNDHGLYFAAAARSKVFVGSNAVAGVAPGTALGTTPPIALWNPPNSGKMLSILQLQLGYISGTLGAGTVAHAYVASQTTVPTTGTELTPVCSALGAAASNVGRLFTGSTVASTPLILRPAFMLGAALASSVSFPIIAQDFVDGAIVVPPGAVWCAQGIAAAGTTPLVIFGVTWEEISGAISS